MSFLSADNITHPFMSPWGLAWHMHREALLGSLRLSTRLAGCPLFLKPFRN